MKRKTLVILLVIAATVGFAWWWFVKRDKTDHLAVVPKDAVLVCSINLRSLAEKLQMDELKKLAIYKQLELLTLMDKSMAKLKESIEHPVGSGLDLTAEPAFFVAKNGHTFQLGLAFRLLSAGSFEEKITEHLDGDNKVHEKDGLKYVSFSSDNQILAWQGSKALFLMQQNISGDFDDNYRKPISNTESNLVAVEQLFSQTEDKCIMANTDFVEFRTLEHELNMFMNYEQYMKVLTQLQGRMHYPQAGIFGKLSHLYKDMHAGLRLVFDNNRMSMLARTYYKSGSIAEKAGMILKQPDQALLKQVTDRDAYLFMSAAFDMPKYISLIGSFAESGKIFDKIEEKIGLSKNDLMNLLGGDFAFGITDVKIVNRQTTQWLYNEDTDEYEEVPTTMQEPMPTMTLSATVKNRDNFVKLMEKAFTPGQKGMWRFEAMRIPVFAAEGKNGFTFTNDSNLAHTIAAGKPLGNLPQAALKLATEHPMAMYVDLNLKKLPEPLVDYIEEKAGIRTWKSIKQYMAMFKDIQMTGDMKEMRLDINMTDSDDNSLFRLLAEVDKLTK